MPRLTATLLSAALLIAGCSASDGTAEADELLRALERAVTAENAPDEDVADALARAVTSGNFHAEAEAVQAAVGSTIDVSVDGSTVRVTADGSCLRELTLPDDPANDDGVINDCS